MNFIGVDLHKKSITICVMDEQRGWRGKHSPARTDKIVEFCGSPPFKVVVEATASYLWSVELGALAEKVVLANLKKLPVIADHQEDRSPARPGPH